MFEEIPHPEERASWRASPRMRRLNALELAAAAAHVTRSADREGAIAGDFKYKAFISYSWSDRKWGEWLHHALETYRAPKSAGATAPLKPIFKDREEEAAGHSIGAAIEAALSASEFLIVLCSPNSARSTWVNREVAWFKTHRDPLKILTVIVAGEPMASLTPGREAEECFPKTLLYRVGADLQPTENLAEAPLAADAREAGDGKRGAKLKLAAAMLGLGLDHLVRRDDRRRAQRRRLVMGAMVASIAVLGGLTVFAFNQRNAAVAARNDAVAARKDAEFQKTEAQDLVEFMLTDLRQRLDAVGRLDILDAVAKRLLESYDKQDLAKLDPDALGRRARVLLLLGEVENTRGNLDAALARYKEAAATTEELLRRAPMSAQQIFDHAQSVFWVGYIAWQRGDAAEAKKQFTQYKDYADQLVAIDPEKEEWLAEVDYANSNLGMLALDQGEAAEAEAFFRKSLKASKSLAERNPDGVDKQVSLAQSFAWLADSLYRQALFFDAQNSRRIELAIYQKILQDDPDNTSVKMKEITAQVEFGRILTATGDLSGARAYLLKAKNNASDLVKTDPENLSYTERASFSGAQLGEIYLYLGDKDAARHTLAAAVEFGEKLAGMDSNVLLWRGKFLSESEIALAKVDASDQRIADAMELFSKAVVDLRNLLTAGTAEPTIIRRYCESLAGRARLSSDYQGAWTEIISILGPRYQRQGPEALTLLAEAQIRTGRADEARELARQLFTANYRHPEFLALLDEFPNLKAAAMAGPAAQ